MSQDPPSSHDPDARDPKPSPGLPVAVDFDVSIRRILEGRELNGGALDALVEHAVRVVACNAHFNMTRIVEPEDVSRQQVLDCVEIAGIIRSIEAGTILDLGSGTGYPGIPIGILQPDRSITLSESVGKKARFLEETVAALGLSNVRVRAERGEQLLREDPHDLIVARAVASLEKLLSLLHPVRHQFRRLAIAKGPRLSDEMEEARRYFQSGGPYEVVDLKSYDIGGEYSRRFLLVVETRVQDRTTSKARGPRRSRRGPRGL